MKRLLIAVLFALPVLAQTATSPSKPYISAGIVSPAKWLALGVPVPPGPPLYQVVVTGLPADVLAVRIVIRFDQGGTTRTETRIAQVIAGPYAAAYASIPVSESDFHLVSLVVDQLKIAQSDEFAPSN